MGRVVDALLRRAKRAGFRRALSGEHWAWFLVAGAAWLLDRARQPDDPSAKIDLRPGDRYVVTVVPGGKHAGPQAGRRGRRERERMEGGRPGTGGAGRAGHTDGPDRPDAE